MKLFWNYLEIDPLSNEYLEEYVTYESENEEQIYTCEVCNKQFATKSVLNRYMRLHTGKEKLIPNSELQNEQLKCDLCCITFSNINYKQKHMLEHQILDYECEDCGITFPEKSQYQKHVKIHKVENPTNKCTECPKKFMHPWQLKRHKLTHSGEKPFMCNQCDKAYGQKSHLKDHMRTHTGEKPFRCDICDINFASISGEDTFWNISSIFYR